MEATNNKSSEQPPELSENSKLSKSSFIIKGQIGGGSFGNIYRAYDNFNKREVAIKIIHKDYIYESNEKDYISSCIKREIANIRLCKCENVVELYDSIELEDEFILSFELCDTDLLHYIIENYEHQTNLDFISNIFIQLNNAFKILTQKKIIHRDIKPENIFLKFENNKIIPKLGDFGISRTFYENENDKNIDDSPEKHHTDPGGTFNYMAPEILKGEPYNNKCDLFSIGATLYVLVFKEPPFPGNSKTSKINYMTKCGLESLKKTGIESFDDLILKLLEISPEKRISMEEYLNHKFFKENINNLEKPILNKSEEHMNSNNKDNKEINKIKDCALSMIDIMTLPNAFTSKEKIEEKSKKVKIANILYYDENIEKHLNDIHIDSDIFERKTSGAFVLCTNIFSLNLVMSEIKKYNLKYDKRVLFNLIVTGSQFQKVMDNLENKKYENFIQNICIYCMNIQKYKDLKNKYNKLIGVYNTQKQVEEFIDAVSSTEIREFPTLKIVTYNDYKEKYHDRHEKISEFYGDLTKETYNEYINKMENYIDLKDPNDLRKDKKVILDGLKTFNISKDLETLDKLVIKEYTKNTFHGDLNNWLRILDYNAYEAISYFTSRLMYSLNNYAQKSNLFFKEKQILYRGAKTNYINLLPFERLKGKKILLTSFTSSSESLSVANIFSGREKAKEIFKEYKKFSVIYKITNNVMDDCIPCGIDIQALSDFTFEKEILFQPFTFYLVKNVDFNFIECTADIELETISKKEILEEKIKYGKKVIYDQKLRLLYID